MLCARLLTVAAAASLGLASGCYSVSNHPWFEGFGFGRSSTCGGGACCEAGACCPIEDGPVLQDYGPYVGPQPGPVAVPPGPLAPPPGPLAPPPGPGVLPPGSPGVLTPAPGYSGFNPAAPRLEPVPQGAIPYRQ